MPSFGRRYSEPSIFRIENQNLINIFMKFPIYASHFACIDAWKLNKLTIFVYAQMQVGSQGYKELACPPWEKIWLCSCTDAWKLKKLIDYAFNGDAWFWLISFNFFDEMVYQGPLKITLTFNLSNWTSFSVFQINFKNLHAQNFKE